jgi:hypothetical protein
MSSVNMVRDSSGAPLQALRINGTTATATTSGTTARVALPGGLGEGELCRIAATADTYVQFGNSAVDATADSVLFPAGVEYVVVPSGSTHLAYLQVSAAGRIQILEVS